MRQSNPWRSIGQRSWISQHRVHKFRFGQTGELLREFASLWHGGVRRNTHEMQLIEADLKNRLNRAARLVFGRNHETQRELLPDAAVEKLLNERRGFFEQFIGV